MSIWPSYTLICDWPIKSLDEAIPHGTMPDHCGALFGHAHTPEELGDLAEEAVARDWLIRSAWGEIGIDYCPVHAPKPDLPRKLPKGLVPIEEWAPPGSFSPGKLPRDLGGGR
jgi:hypothetical protein